LNLSHTGVATDVLNTYYTDAGQVPLYAVDSVAAATQAHLVVNYPDVKTLNPRTPLTRAEAAAILDQALVHLGQLPPLASNVAAASYIVGGPTPQSSGPSAKPQSSEPFAKPASRDRWKFSVEPYFFVPLHVRVDTTVAGRSSSIHLGFGDILRLDRALDAGLRLEAHKNRLGLILDGFYVFAKQSGNFGVTFPGGSLQDFGINTDVTASSDATVSIRQGTVDLAASYRVVDTSLGNSASSFNPYPRLAFAPIVGLRANFLSQKLEVGTTRIGNISLPVNQNFSSSRTTVEPLIGAQIGLDLSERWAVGIRGDVSGFNINADRDLTWNLLVDTQYHLSPSTLLQLGYRFNNFDFEDGSGLRRTRVNLHQNGLLLSVIFRF